MEYLLKVESDNFTTKYFRSDLILDDGSVPNGKENDN